MNESKKPANERPTPETDAAEWLAEDGSGGVHSVVSIHSARKLERERDEARCDEAMWRDHTIAALRQRDELLEALERQACLTAYYNGHSGGYKPHPNGGLFWENYLCAEARSAIAKVKGSK